MSMKSPSFGLDFGFYTLILPEVGLFLETPKELNLQTKPDIQHVSDKEKKYGTKNVQVFASGQ